MKNRHKATFIAHLLWLDFVYRAKLTVTLPIAPARLIIWLPWLEEALRGCEMPGHVLRLIVTELEHHEPENFALFLARCTDRDQWHRRWLRLLALAIKSDAVDEVGAAITAHGVQNDSQSTLQAFLWSTKGLEC